MLFFRTLRSHFTFPHSGTGGHWFHCCAKQSRKTDIRRSRGEEPNVYLRTITACSELALFYDKVRLRPRWNVKGLGSHYRLGWTVPILLSLVRHPIHWSHLPIKLTCYAFDVDRAGVYSKSRLNPPDPKITTFVGEFEVNALSRHATGRQMRRDWRKFK